MRTYPSNSPEAAARLVALVLISDGHVCRSELDALDRLEAAHELGLQPDAMSGIVQTLCEDLLLGAYASGSLVANVDEAALTSLVAEVTDPVLRGRVLRLAVAVANADRHLAEGELLVIEAAYRRWAGAEAALVGDRTPPAWQVN
ncbi:TerB family tellurite resistance protein [Aquabacterium sp.]|uniref:TerB family tellurite resistance protein n=1 Tax=Aquabacterium sp. TaxID=1872578 RepID=UPI00248A8A5D|nr:TerB family tellurite resistance protein [Aquabacterium sp.]MDI1260492.1 TerB family tellurite resistance protein [Aquabacterium sp.]